jgi:hypothetical protein
MMAQGREGFMSYYLLTILRSGSIAYQEAADSKHYIDAPDIAHAKIEADVAIHNHYDGKIDKAAVIKLFDESGLVATRIGEGSWDA